MSTRPRENLALITNYYPDRRPLSEYGYHLAHGLRHGNTGDLSVLSGRTSAPSNGALRVWTYGSVKIPLEIEHALRARGHTSVLFNTIFTNWGGNVTNLAGMLTPLFARRRGLVVMTLLHHLPQTIDARRAGYRLTLLHNLAIELACRAVAAASDVVCFTMQRDLDFSDTATTRGGSQWCPLDCPVRPNGYRRPKVRGKFWPSANGAGERSRASYHRVSSERHQR